MGGSIASIARRWQYRSVELPRGDRLAVSNRVLALAGLVTVVTAAMIAVVDQPVARWVSQFEPSPLWDRGIDALEWAILLPVWKLGSAVLVVAAMLVAMIVPRLRVHAPALMVIAGTHVITRFLMNQGKELTGRLRPHQWLEVGGDTFFRDGLSFPSGHVVLFASIVVPIAVLYPRTSPLVAIAAYAMVARVAVSAHFLSDVTSALALVLLVTWGLGWLVRPCPPRTLARAAAS